MQKQFHVKCITINGIPQRVVADPEEKLVKVIRNQLHLTGTKLGCGQGQCGACNVILDGKVTRSCIVPWKAVPENADILTIEGIGTPDRLHAIQWAFIANGAIQCGFCTPGFIVAAKGLLDTTLNPTREEIRDWFQKHWTACRCTGYKQITDAVMDAAAVLRGEKPMTDFAKALKPGDCVWGTRYPRPSAIFKATGTFDYGDDSGLKLPEGSLHAVCVCP